MTMKKVFSMQALPQDYQFTITSYHTNSIFPIVDNVDCNTKCIIINDLVCERSYTGCTADSAKTRIANPKSYIKFGRISKANKLLCWIAQNLINRGKQLGRIKTQKTNLGKNY